MYLAKRPDEKPIVTHPIPNRAFGDLVAYLSRQGYVLGQALKGKDRQVVFDRVKEIIDGI